MEVEVKNLKRYYGSTRAVDDISFTFRAGQIAGFVGPNGAGKTTTMRILATADEPTGGDAFVDGGSVVAAPARGRRRVGCMPDYLAAHADVSVREYLDFFARAYGLRGARRRATIESVEEFTNLTDIRHKVLKALSKGMKQRVSLARAMVHDPAVLLLDEPAAGLDPRARIELRELLRALAERGKAILVSSHILTELSEICHATVIIEQGRLVRAGDIQAILAQDMPRRLLSIRMRGRPEDLCKHLVLKPHVLTARVVGAAADVDFDGDEEALQALLADLIRDGLPIVEFKLQKAGLEQLFMNVTKGRVQ